MLLPALAVAAFVLLIAQFAVFGRLEEHRTDLRPGDGIADGASPVWQVNAFSPNNYTPQGQRLLALFAVLYAGFVAAAAALALLLFRR